MMEELLSPNRSYTLVSWVVKTQNKAVKRSERYIVTAMSHYKQRSSWPNLQPEYITLLVQPPPDLPQPALGPVLIKVSRDPVASRPSRYRLWGATVDRVTILGPAANVELHDERLHYLHWPIDEAPILEAIASEIHFVHTELPPNYLWLDRCCYTFVHVLLQTVYLSYYYGMPGVRGPWILVPNTLLVTIGGSTMKHYKRVAKEMATEGEAWFGAYLEEAEKGWYPWVWFILAWIVPIRVTCVWFLVLWVQRA